MKRQDKRREERKGWRPPQRPGTPVSGEVSLRGHDAWAAMVHAEKRWPTKAPTPCPLDHWYVLTWRSPLRSSPRDIPRREECHTASSARPPSTPTPPPALRNLAFTPETTQTVLLITKDLHCLTPPPRPSKISLCVF